MSKNLIHHKRENLVRFIREQTLGPGISGYRFLELNNPIIDHSSLIYAIPLENQQEIIDAAPATLYSTGILFPENKSTDCKSVPNRHTSETDDGLEDNESTISEIDEDEIDEVLSPNQAFPNAMGLSCCFDKTVLLEKNLSVKIYARSYASIKGEKEINDKIGVLLEQDLHLFKNFISKFNETDILRQKIKIKEGINNIIYFKDLDSLEVAQIKERIRTIDRAIAVQLGSDREYQTISGYKEFLSKSLVSKTGKEQTESIEKVQTIENAENSIAHINNLLNIYDPRSFGLYQCKIHEIDVPIILPTFEEIHGKKIYTYHQVEALKDLIKIDLDDIKGNKTHASLSVNLQYSKNTRENDDKIYLKVQLVNTSSPFRTEETPTRFYSVANEIINQRSFFGVGIQVYSPELIPYREVHLNSNATNFSEEEINQHLYRQYQDFGIGHGCAVKWNINSQETKMVETEYIPITDIPDVDPIPRNKTKFIATKNNTFEPEPYFLNAKFLEFKWLSSLSNVTDKEVLEGLNRFTDTYELWINTNKSRDKQNINKQILDACTSDQERIKENINLILSSPSNLKLFRWMNTAMFMQMWHSVKAKKGQVSPFIQEANFKGFDNDFYKNADDKLFGDFPAAWRPFQLAFILLNLDGIFQTL